MMDSPDHLKRECRVFCRYLIGAKPTPAVVASYVAAHERARALSEGSDFDRILIRIARTTSVLTKVADMHARWFVPSALLRNKLVLLLAILEATAPFSRMVGYPIHERPALVVADAAVRCATAAVGLLFGVLLFLPFHLFLSCFKLRS